MKRLSIALITSVALASNVYAELKIGVVNTDEIILKSPLAQSYNEKISKDFMPRQIALNDAQKKLQDDLDKLNYQSFQLSQADRVKLQETINADRVQFDQLNNSLQRDLLAARNQYTQLLSTKLSALIGKIAKDGKYDLIQTNANVMFLNSAIDLTPQIISQLK